MSTKYEVKTPQKIITGLRETCAKNKNWVPVPTGIALDLLDDVEALSAKIQEIKKDLEDMAGGKPL